MEYDDGSRLNVWNYIAGTCIAADIAVVITADYVPHYCVVSFMKYPCLIGTYTGIRRTEQIGFYHVPCNVNIPYIVSGVHAPSLYMAV